MFCHKCGNQLPDNAIFCNKCGTKVYKNAENEQLVSVSTDESESILDSETTNTNIRIEKELLETFNSQSVMSPPVASYHPEPSPPKTSVQIPDKPIRETAEQSQYDQDNFIRFVNSHVKANTEFNSALDLLNSKPKAKFAWLSYGISAAIMFVLSIFSMSLGNGIWVIPFLLSLSILPGYLAALISSFVAKGKLINKYTLKFKGQADSEELKIFLDTHLSYLKPYFDTWGDSRIIGYGLKGTAEAAFINATTDIMQEHNIVSYFGANNSILLNIAVRPDIKGNPEYTICGFSADSERMGSHFIASYKCIIKTAPILQAALKYYFMRKNGDTISISDSTYVEQGSGPVQSAVQTSENSYHSASAQSGYIAAEKSCASARKKALLKQGLLGAGILGAIAFIVIIVLTKGMETSLTNADNTSAGISNVVLSNSYTSKDGGFSLKYPSDWNIIPSSTSFVELNSPDGMANIQVIECFYDPFGMFTESEAEIKKAVNQLHTFTKLWDTKIDDVSVKALSYQTDGLKGKRTVNNYWYNVGENLYQIICSYEESVKENYAAVFDKIIDSFSINDIAVISTTLISTPSNSNPTISTASVTIDGIEYNIESTTGLNKESVSYEDIKKIGQLVNLTTLYLDDVQTDDITPLANLSKLKTLNLYNGNFNDITAISGLKNLNTLYIGSNQVSDITPLENLTNLTSLIISSNQIQNIGSLKNLKKLKSLTLYGDKIKDLSILADLDSLNVLKIQDNTYSGKDLEQFVSNPELPPAAVTTSSTTAITNNTPNNEQTVKSTATSPPPMQTTPSQFSINMTDLTYIYKDDAISLLQNQGFISEIVWVNDDFLPSNYVIKTNPPAGTRVEIGTTVMVYVSLGASSRTVLVPNFVGLTEDEAYTEAYNNSLIPVFEYAPCEDGSIEKGKVMSQSINPNVQSEEGSSVTLTISTGKSIETVEICGRSYEVDYDEALSFSRDTLNNDDMENIGKLTKLTKLSFLDCGVNNYAPIANLTNLEEIRIAYSGFKDLSLLKNMSKLTLLDIQGYSITDVSPLENLTSLRDLSLSSSEITDISKLRNLTNLTTLYIYDTGVTDITPLASLKNLEILYYSKSKIAYEDICWLKEQLPNCKFYAV